MIDEIIRCSFYYSIASMWLLYFAVAFLLASQTSGESFQSTFTIIDAINNATSDIRSRGWYLDPMD